KTQTFISRMEPAGGFSFSFSVEGSPSPAPVPSTMSIDRLLPALLECFGIILCGYIAGRANIITSTQAKGLGNFVSKFALPALLFKNMVLLDFGNVIWPFLWGILVAKVSVFCIVCVLTLIVSSPDSRYSKAGLFSVFATQSNDFALGYPIGIIAHFALHQRIPAFMAEFIDGLANSFGGAALFYLGLTMVGQLRRLTRSTVVTLILLITAKLAFSDHKSLQNLMLRSQEHMAFYQLVYPRLIALSIVLMKKYEDLRGAPGALVIAGWGIPSLVTSILLIFGEKRSDAIDSSFFYGKLQNFSSSLWLLYNHLHGRLYLELQFFCAIANYGQGFISFALFGLDKHFILLPLKRCGVRTMLDCFRGCELVDWLQQVGLAQDRGEAVLYGTRLQQGRVLQHIKQEYSFEDSQLHYYFTT
ncbi:hypothetical protein GOODEAATRI_012409, partial [Goodea atripinnis]